jgi:hypothetical protein
MAIEQIFPARNRFGRTRKWIASKRGRQQISVIDAQRCANDEHKGEQPFSLHFDESNLE